MVRAWAHSGAAGEHRRGNAGRASSVVPLGGRSAGHHIGPHATTRAGRSVRY